MLAFFKGLYKVISSLGVAVVLLLFLLLLTLLGTIEQIEHGLFATQNKYFTSAYLVLRFFDVIPVPLPGVMLLSILLFFNILLGGITTFVKDWSRLGLLAAHLGIVFLLLGGFVTHQFSDYGNMALQEGESSNTFQSYNEWEVTVTPVTASDETDAVVIPETAFIDLGPENTRTVTSPALPFTVTFSDFVLNGRPMPADGTNPGSSENRVVDGAFLASLPPEKEHERNLSGVYVTLTSSTGETRESILWGGQNAPWTVPMENRDYVIDFHKRRWPLPFTVTLDKFTRKTHARTSMPSAFVSEVTRTEDGTAQQVRISMNEPMRYKGYTFYQASFGSIPGPQGEELFSVLAVARNPADRWPIYACAIITAGLILHFGSKLTRYLKQENKRNKQA